MNDTQRDFLATLTPAERNALYDLAEAKAGGEELNQKRALAIFASHGVSRVRALAIMAPHRKPQSYAYAVNWIALNDSPADQSDPDTIRGWVSVALVADLYGRTQDETARDVIEARRCAAIGRNTREPLGGSPD